MRILRLNNSGIILLVVLWTVVVLTILAITLGRSTNIELALTKNAVGGLQAKYLAWTAVAFATQQLATDLSSDDGEVDTLYKCGISGDIASIQNQFKKTEIGEGYFSVSQKEMAADGKRQMVYGLEDEERKINLNALTAQSMSILKTE